MHPDLVILVDVLIYNIKKEREFWSETPMPKNWPRSSCRLPHILFTKCRRRSSYLATDRMLVLSTTKIHPASQILSTDFKYSLLLLPTSLHVESHHKATNLDAASELVQLVPTKLQLQCHAGKAGSGRIPFWARLHCFGSSVSIPRGFPDFQRWTVRFCVNQRNYTPLRKKRKDATSSQDKMKKQTFTTTMPQTTTTAFEMKISL